MNFFKKIPFNFFIISAMVVLILVLSSTISNITHKIVFNTYEEKIQDIVRATNAQISGYIELNKNGKITKQELEENIKKIVKNTKTLGGEYVFMIDTNANMIIHPLSQKLNGTYVGEMKDPEGKKLFIEMVKLQKQMVVVLLNISGQNQV